MPSPLSIITICRNIERDIVPTAASIVHQTCQDFEWIVIDGASTDKTVENLNSVAGARVDQLVSEPDKGLYDAMNKGASRATGDWLVFMNGGDSFVDTNVLETVIPELQKRNSGVVVGGHMRVWPDGRPPIVKPMPHKPDMHFFYRHTIRHQSSFIARSTFEKYGPHDTTFRILADRAFFAKVALGGEPFETIPTTVSAYDMTGLSARMKHSAEMRLEEKRIHDFYPPTYRVRRVFNDAYVAIRDGGKKRKD